MSKIRRRKPELIRSQDLEEITALLGMEFNTKVIEPLKSVLDFIETIRATQVIPDPAVPRITMRAKTFHIIMNAFRSRLKSKDYEESLISAGRSAGYSFADDLFKFLADNYLIPQDEEVLIRIWTLFDTNAGWGDFKGIFDGAKKQIEISVDITIHAPFLKGYIEGVCWGLLKLYPRMFRKEFRVEREYLEPVTVDMEVNDVWIFRSKLKNEELKFSFDCFYEAKNALQVENYDEVVLNARRALESAFKLKIGLDLHQIVHLPDLFKIYKDSGVTFDYNLAKDIYGRASSKIHTKEELTKDWCIRLINDLADILRDIELYELTEEKQRIMREKLQKIIKQG
jgi:hypothetical protein